MKIIYRVILIATIVSLTSCIDDYHIGDNSVIDNDTYLTVYYDSKRYDTIQGLSEIDANKILKFSFSTYSTLIQRDQLIQKLENALVLKQYCQNGNGYKILNEYENLVKPEEGIYAYVIFGRCNGVVNAN